MTARLRGAALGALLFVLGCASAPAPDGSGSPPAATDQQVMVTYAPALPMIWAQNTAEIARRYGLSVVYAWTMESLGEQCVVFEAPRGRSVQEIIRHLSADPRVSIAQTVATFQTQGGDPDRKSVV